MSIDIPAQIGFVVLVALASKNRDRVESGRGDKTMNYSLLDPFRM